jgi:phage terminase large subunit
MLLHSNSPNILVYGGSRSGKSFAIVAQMVADAYIYPGIRQLIGRSALAHAKASIWSETVMAVLKHYPVQTYTVNHSDLYVQFYNGSELHVVGFDSDERTEKIFGREFACIYLNEASQITYDVAIKVSTRLAQHIEGYANRLIYDCNPPSPSHFLYKLFIQKVGMNGKALPNPLDYVSIKLNPVDNPLLPAQYIKNLELLPEGDRKRFLLGEFVKAEGAIYNKFDISRHCIEAKDLPKGGEFIVGIDDTGTNYAAVLIKLVGEKAYICDEHTAFRETIANFDSTIRSKWQHYNYIAYADPAAAQLNDQIWNCTPAENAVEPGINYVKQLIEFGNFYIVTKDGQPKASSLVAEMDSYRYDDKGRILKQNDHLCDALRYGLFSHRLFGGSILKTIEVQEVR